MSKNDAVICLHEAVASVQAGSYYLSPAIQEALLSSAPKNPVSIRRRVMTDFDYEGSALYACASRLTGSDQAAWHTLRSAFLAYSLALREDETMPGAAQTWLLLSVAALANPRPPMRPNRWSWWQEHPADAVLESYWSGPSTEPRRTKLLQHLAGCGSCRLAWSLAAFDASPHAATLAGPMRSEIASDLEHPNEIEVFLAYAERQYRVMQLASSELERLLGTTAKRDWSQRQAAAGSWLGALLGKTKTAP
jgi:hypothetical protein